MSLVLRGLRGRGGKLPEAVSTVNGLARRARAFGYASAMATLLAACPVTFHDVPNESFEDWPEYLGAASRAVTALESIDSAPRRVWKTEAGRGTVGAVALAGRLAAIATVDRWIYLLDARTGRLYWRYRGTEPFGAGPVISRGTLFAGAEGANGGVVAVHLRTGRRRWFSRLGDTPAALTARDSSVYGSTSTGLIFALDRTTGRRRWVRQLGRVSASPLLIGDALAVVSLSDSLFILDAATGLVRSRRPAGGAAASPLALAGTLAVANLPSGAIAAFDPAASGSVWRVETGAFLGGSPAVWQDTVFALSTRCVLWRVPLSAPADARPLDLGCGATRATPGLTRDGVLVATVAGNVAHYDRATGRLLWTRPAGGELRQPPSVRHGQIVIAPVLGPVVSFR